MKTWYSLLVAGCAGTLVMTLFLFVPRWAGWSKVDVIRAGGALLVGMNARAFATGMGIHLVMGVGFSFLYAAFLGFSHLPFNTLTGALLGSLQGVVVMLLVAILIMEHHPIARYHERGPATGLAHLGAHILYGATVGWVVGLMN